MIYLIIVLLLVLIVFIIFTVNSLKARGKASGPDYIPEPVSPDAAKRLAQAVSIPTVSYTDYSKIDIEHHRRFQKFLTEAFPAFHKAAERTVLSDYALIYKLAGKSEDKKPVLFMAHYDVVPVNAGDWTHEPFGGVIDDEFIWGRGTLDTKNSLMASLEAAEALCAEGFVPDRTIYFAFGGDEEVLGLKGAGEIKKWFIDKDITVDWLLDEGAVTGDGLIGGMKKKLTLIGTAEKGMVDYLLTAKSSGGHASMPPKISATGRIARAVTRLEANPFRLRWLATTRALFSNMASAASPALRIMLSNLWLTRGLVKAVMGKSSTSAALLRTTMAPTMISGSNKENVLAREASAVVNVRILPGETIASVLRQMEKIVNDSEVSITVKNPEAAGEPVAESSTDSEGYRLIEEAVAETIPDSIVLPFLVTATTDSRQYTDFCRDIYRYCPVILTQTEVNRIHSVDERISLDNYGLCIRTYKILMSKL